MVRNRGSKGSYSAQLAQRLQSTTIFRHQIGHLAADLRRRRVPNHWTNLFGVVTVACLLTVTITGLLLMFFYTSSSVVTTYTGPYLPLQGARVSQAFASAMRITFEVPGGLLLRQIHHWAALLLPASIIMQILITFFTGAFRRPRRGMWVLLFLIYLFSLVGGWSGYALPDDMLSGTGLQITAGIASGIPLVGTWLSFLLFGGEFPGEVIEHLYPIHVVVVPVILIAFVALHGLSAWHHKPAQFDGPGRTEKNIIGVSLLPVAATKAGGLLAIVIGILVFISSMVTVNPIWLYGPAAPGNASAGSQPDWYTGFLDGALRLVPPGWEIVWLDRTWTLAILVPLLVVTLYLLAVAVYPFIEEWVTGDQREHHLLSRPRNTPTRTGIGVAAVLFYLSLWLAGGADLIATGFRLSFESVIGFLQVALIVCPWLGFVIARTVCLGLQQKDREILLHGFETGRIVRLPGGEYVDVHQPLSEFERRRLVDASGPVPVFDQQAGSTLTNRLRVTLSRFFFEDRIEPHVSQRRFHELDDETETEVQSSP